jgi:hypothetical protein
MNLLMVMLIFVTAGDSSRTVTVRPARHAPKIDGVLEDVWFEADSVNNFTQAEPDEGKAPSELTTVYVLQDADNLYVAFRCLAARSRPIAAMYGMEEEATVFIDPMDSRSSGYFFKVYGSGLYRSGKILDDGADQDWSWEAVWYQADRLYDDRWEVEMKIPFKSIRYKVGASEWGINFHRFITAGMEHDFWTVVRDREGGNRVSNYGRLIGIAPRAHGYYFELYPEGYVRYDEDQSTQGHFTPRASLNMKWDATPQTTLNATVLPDFAQIESDPYSFNLSRYPMRLGERRPFFVEGSEIFRMSGLGDCPFTPLSIFYSRRIGKAVSQEPVPIISGLKLTTKSEGWNLGVLGAYTDQLGDSNRILEPRRGFGVLSAQTRLRDTTALGVMFSGTQAGPADYNYALGIDVGRAFRGSRGVFQAALSDRSGKLGWAVNSGFMSFQGGLLGMGMLDVTSDSFDVSDIGFVPWAGRTRLQAAVGPYIRGDGALNRVYIAPGINYTQEPGSSQPSYGLALHANPQFRNGWGLNLDCGVGRSFEAEQSYLGRYASVSLNALGLAYNLNMGGACGYSYNYQRGFIADNYSDWCWFTYYLFRRAAVMVGVNNNWESDPTGKTLAVTSVASPRIDFRITANMTFNVYNEIVLVTPETRIADTRFTSNRVGCLFSWNFRPKSWIYLAFNDFRIDYGDGLKLADRVGAAKLRYLFYF